MDAISQSLCVVSGCSFHRRFAGLLSFLVRLTRAQSPAGSRRRSRLFPVRCIAKLDAVIFWMYEIAQPWSGAVIVILCERSKTFNGPDA